MLRTLSRLLFGFRGSTIAGSHIGLPSSPAPNSKDRSYARPLIARFGSPHVSDGNRRRESGRGSAGGGDEAKVSRGDHWPYRPRRLWARHRYDVARLARD